MTCFRCDSFDSACSLLPAFASAQTPAAQAPPADQSDPDVRVDALQPDFNLASLPTTLRMPLHKLVVPGDAPVHASAWTGGLRRPGVRLLWLRLRRANRPRTAIWARARHADWRPSHQRSDDTDLRATHVLNERDGKPMSLDGIATLEGANNLHAALPEHAWGSGFAKGRGPRGALRRADLRHQLEPVRECWRRQQHPDGRSRRAASHQAFDVSRRGRSHRVSRGSIRARTR